jgi:DMSO/TMAO reductase YedYZ molybdopterin-dependent catalytic subunit
MSIVNRGFGRRRPVDPEIAKRIPPGQHLVPDFPVLSVGPTPRTELRDWSFEIAGEIDFPRKLSWVDFKALPSEAITTDIHCVTSWSKLDTRWEGVSLDTLLEDVETEATHVMAFCDGGYETNLPLEDVTDGKAWLAHTYGGEPLDPEHGGPVRLLVPHLYFWKSAKWVRGLRLMDGDEPGFWERNGYHLRGDPWQEERYSGD